MFPVCPPRSGIRSARLSGCFPLHPGRGGSGNCRFVIDAENRPFCIFILQHSCRFRCQPVDTSRTGIFFCNSRSICSVRSICASRSAFRRHRIVLASHAGPDLVPLFSGDFFSQVTPAAGRSGFIKTLSSGHSICIGFRSFPAGSGSGRKNVYCHFFLSHCFLLSLPFMHLHAPQQNLLFQNPRCKQ